MRIYQVIEDRNKQLVRLKKPISTYSDVIDQSQLDTLYIRYSGGFLFDEVRVGPAYESVILGTVTSELATN